MSTPVVKFVMTFLEEHIGKRKAKQVMYLILLAVGVERKIIKETFGASNATLCKYNAAVKAENPKIIFEQNYNRPVSELEKHRDEIMEELEKNPVSTRREAAVIIEGKTGIKRSVTQVGEFLKKGGSKNEL